MIPFDFPAARERIQEFDFTRLFVDVLGWNRPGGKRVEMAAGGSRFSRRQVAELSGVVVFEVASDKGPIPDAKSRAALHKEIAALHHENLLIFVDQRRTQSLWYWVKRDGGKTYPRQHLYVREQPGDLLLSKLGAIVFDISELDEQGNIPVAEVARRLKESLDVEPVTKKFYVEFQQQHIAFLELIRGIGDERQRRWYASVLLNRLMFIYFLQRKSFIDGGNLNYLQDKLAVSRAEGKDLYYRQFLRLLFFEGFAKPEEARSAEARKRLGKVEYLDGGLFLPHPIEEANPDIDVPDRAFANLLDLFARYSWNLNDTPGGDDDEINPDVLGYIFEKYINQKAFGAYYTRPEITEYLCERTVHRLILDGVSGPEIPGVAPAEEFDSIADLLMNLNASLCRRLLFDVLPKLSLLDPACGSGAFLVAAMKTLIGVYAAVIGRIKFLGDRNLTAWLKKVEREHKSASYFIKKSIIVDNLFGVDIMEEATEIAKLRLFLALVAAVENASDLEPLPNIDFNILAGNSLIGLMHVDDEQFNQRHAQAELFRPSYQQLLKEKNRLIDTYRHASSYAEDLTALRDEIQRKKGQARAALDDILLDEFKGLGIKFEQATWDNAKKREGKAVKRPLTVEDIRALQPFHWGYEFDEILNQRGGFDAILANPPWESVEPRAKEFFAEHSALVSKNKMTLEEFEKEQEELLKKPGVMEAWLDYHSRFNHVRQYFRTAPQFENQVPIIDGKRHGKDVNLYKLFLERCFTLLRDNGRCGIIVSSGVYTDLGAKRLRELLFSNARVDRLIALSNERYLFEGVHHSWRLCLLSFQKGGRTSSFMASFRINPREAIGPDTLDAFLHAPSEYVEIQVALVRRLSPDSLAVMEIRGKIDVSIVEKMLRFPPVGHAVANSWRLELHREFNMTDDARLFRQEPGKSRRPLYEGKMIHQFDHRFGKPRYWLDEREARATLLPARLRIVERIADEHKVSGAPKADDLTLDYQSYRLAFRDVTASTNERTMIAAVLPPGVFCPHTMTLEAVFHDYVQDGVWKPNTPGVTAHERLYILAMLNSFVADNYLRQKVTNHLSFFIVYNLPVPRLAEADPALGIIVNRAARLTCTTPEFDDLAREIGLRGHDDAANDPAERGRLRAELDGLVAHLYGLTEEEFAHVLGAFPIVPASVKDAAMEAYHRFASPMSDEEIGPILLQGEGPRVEFKSTARWDLNRNEKNGELEKVIVKTVCGFLNAEGGTLLIGVDDDGSIVGLEHDYRTVHKKNRDGFELFLQDLLLGSTGKDMTACLRITFHQAEGKDLCRVAVAPSPRPVFLAEGNDDHLYIRSGNSTRRLTTKEAINYEKTRWRAT